MVPYLESRVKSRRRPRRVTEGHPPLLPCKNSACLSRPGVAQCLSGRSEWPGSLITLFVLRLLERDSESPDSHSAWSPGGRSGPGALRAGRRSEITAGTQNWKMPGIPPDRGNVVFLRAPAPFPPTVDSFAKRTSRLRYRNLTPLKHPLPLA